MEEITIARALRRLKTLDKKISKKIDNSCFVNCKIGSDVVKTNCTPKEDLQSVYDLISYRDKLKSAIAQSNAVEVVYVGDMEMTVVEAIERKNSIRFKKELLNSLNSQLAYTLDNIDQQNNDAEKRLDRLIEASVGNDSSKKEIESISKSFMKRNQTTLVDEIDIYSEIEKLRKEIDDFEDNVDIALSESNALTKIEV
jgi:hypothetical protein